MTVGPVSVLLERIAAFYGQTEKMEEAIFDETPDDLVVSETEDAGLYHDKVVRTTANIRLKLQQCQT